MADEEVNEQAAQTRKKRSKLVPIVIIAALMIGEGVGVFFPRQNHQPQSCLGNRC